jgi:hypothetical protein
MTVIPFTPNAAQGCSWSPHEPAALVSIYEAYAARGEASAWDVGVTELGEPQFYILGPAPDLDCAVAISRVGRLYVCEDGAGQVLDESVSFNTIVSRAKAPAGRGKAASLGLTTLAVAVEERMHTLLLEFEDILIRLPPQLAALV